MINLTKLLFADNVSFPGDALRFEPRSPALVPVLVWHMTNRCNLHCRHCYAGNEGAMATEVMSFEEAASFLDSLRAHKPPALLLSGGEPLRHPDFFRHLSKARENGLNVAISSNGTLIDRDAAERIASEGVSYVGVSLDGCRETHDAFRGAKGSFRAALHGIESLASAGCRVGLRITLARPLLPSLDSVFGLVEELPVSRVCFYHFMPTGFGALDPGLMPRVNEERRAVLKIIEWAESASGPGRRSGRPLEVLTVGDASDGVLAYRYLRERDEKRAARARVLLTRSSGHGHGGIGAGILSIRWDGLLFPNQFSWDNPIGRWEDLVSGAYRLPPVPACPSCTHRQICRGTLRRAGTDCMAGSGNCADGRL